MLTTDCAGDQIDGARDYQEDAFLITRLGDAGTLIVVADGMGGHAAGNVASNMAIQAFNKFLTARFPFTQAPAEVLRAAALEANRALTETMRETPALNGMGCTLVGAVIEDNRLHWVSVGDSHLYRWRAGVLQKLNADHSYGGFLATLKAEGRELPPRAGLSPHMLMSVLAGGDIAAIDCPTSPHSLLAGDRLIVASDGVDSLPLPSLTEIVTRGESPRAVVDGLLQAVNAAAVVRQDNTTVVAIHVVEKAGLAPLPDFSAERLARLNSGRGLGPRDTPIPVSPPPPAPARRKGLALAAAALVTAGLLAGGLMLLPEPPVDSAPAETSPASASAQGQRSDAPATAPASASPMQDVADAPAARETVSPASTTPTDVAPSAPTGQPFVDGPGPRMMPLPGGRFLMGSPDSSPRFEERPQHAVELRPFAISVHEITEGEYARFSGRGAGARPRAHVSWHDARAYARWLSRATGQRYRLPTEAEWEYAARGGTAGDYPWGRQFRAGAAHCLACGTALDPRAPAQVGQFPANGFGLKDVAGNLAEWVLDCHAEDYRAAPADGRAFETEGCARRVVRGGSFASAPDALRVTARDALGETSANDGVGFRVVRED